NAGAAERAHDLLPAGEPDGGALAGGAEGRDAAAAVGEAPLGMGGKARQVDSAVRVERQGHGGGQAETVARGGQDEDPRSRERAGGPCDERANMLQIPG